MHHAQRRRFLKASLCVASGALLGTRATARSQEAGKTKTAGSRKPITRKLGKTGLDLPVVNMGVMRADNPALVRAALAEGMVMFDTAHSYQRGRNEEMLGRVLADYPRESFVIATKVGLGRGSSAECIRDFLSDVDISLQRLKMHSVDILYAHGVDSREFGLNPTLVECLKQAKQTGRARFVGFSTHENEPDVLDAAVEGGVCDVVLTAVNFKQDHYPSVKAAIKRAAAAGIGIIGMKTMAGAFYDKARSKPVNCKAALKFVLQDENVSTTIPGITSFEHLAENASVNTDITMSEEERDALVARNLEGGLYCQQCHHCVDGCRKGVQIPTYMRAFMYTYGYRDLGLAHAALSEIEAEENPCTSCDSCTAHCVKGFPLRERIADVQRVRMIPEDLLLNSGAGEA
ncbi:MAG: aldo/keto reductase [Bacteroidetes bacterium]|nr:aldo/keto reductase [Bacteroidota bacterium]